MVTYLTPNTGTATRELTHLDPAQIVPSPYNPRRDFPEAELATLAESIRTFGIQQPLTVRRRPDPKIDRDRAAQGLLHLDSDPATARDLIASDLKAAEGTSGTMELSVAFTESEWTDAKEAYRLVAYEQGLRLDLGPIARGDTPDTAFLGMTTFTLSALDDVGYELIAGESRLRAARLAGLTEVPCLVREVDDRTAALLTLTENLQRQNLDAIEEATGFAVLAGEFGLEQGEIGAQIQRTQAYVSNRLRLLRLPGAVQALIANGQLSAEHGRSLLRFEKWPSYATMLATHAAENHLPVKLLDASGAPLWTEAKRQGIMLDLASADFAAEKVCPACPFGAFLKGESTYGFCLKPDHHDQLNREHREQVIAQRNQARADQDAQLAALRERQRLAASVTPTTPDASAGPGAGTVTPEETPTRPSMPTLDDLSTVPHEILLGQHVPAGCTSACPCALVALNRDGVPTEVCTNPVRVHQLAREEKKAIEDARKRRLEVTLHAAQEQLDQLTAVDGRSLALLLVAVQSGFATASSYNRPDMVEIESALKARYGWTVPLGQERSAEDNRAVLDQLARRDPLALLRYTLEYIVRMDLPRALNDPPRYSGGWSRWFLKLDQGAETEIPLPAPTDPLAALVDREQAVNAEGDLDDDDMSDAEAVEESLLDAGRCPGCGRTFEQLEMLDIPFDDLDCLCATCQSDRGEADARERDAAIVALAEQVEAELDATESTLDDDQSDPEETPAPLIPTYDPDEDAPAPVALVPPVKRGRGRPRKSA